MVEIDWDIPPFNGGSPILSYQIVIRQQDGITFTEDTVNCNGADSGIISSLKC